MRGQLAVGARVPEVCVLVLVADHPDGLGLDLVRQLVRTDPLDEQLVTLLHQEVPRCHLEAYLPLSPLYHSDLPRGHDLEQLACGQELASLPLLLAVQRLRCLEPLPAVERLQLPQFLQLPLRIAQVSLLLQLPLLEVAQHVERDHVDPLPDEKVEVGGKERVDVLFELGLEEENLEDDLLAEPAADVTDDARLEGLPDRVLVGVLPVGEAVSELDDLVDQREERIHEGAPQVSTDQPEPVLRGKHLP